MGSTVGARGGVACARRGFAALALAAFSCAAFAGPPAGTPITNHATGSAVIGAAVQSVTTNTVTATVGIAPIVPGTSAVLHPDNAVMTVAPAVVHLRHTLTNVGPTADTYTLTVVDEQRGFAFESLGLFPDANGDGQPDGATPLPASVSLAPGQSLSFVARYAVPANAPGRAVGIATVRALAASGLGIVPNTDRVGILPVESDCAFVNKALSHDAGPSPGGPVTVTLSYNACERGRSRLVVIDRLPEGMTYVPGSARWTGSGETVLTDAGAADLQGDGASKIAYDFNVSRPGSVTAVVNTLAAHDHGKISFQVRIAGGLETGTIVANTARYSFDESGGDAGVERPTNTATYRVTGRVALELVGQRLPSVAPGTTAVFENVLTNRGTTTDTFDITLGDSTFPSGTTFALFKPDGATPLPDTSGNGVPDTGPVAPGASYRIVVHAAIPASAPPAAYKVTKTARSVTAPAVSASDDDVVDTLERRCAVELGPEHQANIGFGQRVTYTHFLANRGNCVESVQARLDYLRDETPGWASAAYLDNPATGGGSIPGVVDATDTRIADGWNATLPPGTTLRILVEVRAPASPEALEAAVGAKAKAAKATLASNVTTLTISAATAQGGVLSVRDTTYVETGDGAPRPHDAILNFTDETYSAPTPWGVVGGNLWLRADAASCNADATRAETRTVVITGPGGERETLVATETGPGTGIFTLAPLPVRAPPAVADDGVLQGQPGDVFEVDMPGCGTRISTLVTLMEATSAVFDSATNDGIPGAVVTLVRAQGGSCSSTAVDLAGEANPATTGADGRFAFSNVPAGTYCLAVRPPNGHRFPSQVPWPQLPGGRNLQVTGPLAGASYGAPFTRLAAGPLVIDVPVDATAQDGLFVQKTASRQVAEIGDFVDYVVRVSNNTGNALERATVVLEDEMPRGFTLVAGSASRDGRALVDSVTRSGTVFSLPIGTMGRGEVATITYRARIGPGARQGDGINRVHAVYSANGATTRSNTASARVRVSGGVLGERAYIAGRVWLDCNADGVQQAGERGVPGVRLLLEDGTYVSTDAQGKFSFYGITNRTHVLKADATTLPDGARLAPTSARHLGDGGSRLVDLKAGELHRADFAVAGCDADVVKEVEKRAVAAARADELSLAQAQLATVVQAPTDVKALPASGTVMQQGAQGGLVAGALGSNSIATGGVASTPAAGGAGMATVVAGAPASRPSPAPRMAPVPAAAALEPLEKLLPSLDKALAFVGLADGATMPFAQASVRVKGTAGSTLRLAVNGAVVPESRVGKRAVLAERQVQAWEYIGVELAPGRNALTLSQVDNFGNPRGEVTIHVLAPGELARIAIEARAAVADGRTPARVVVRLADANGVPVTSRTPVTLETSRGKWMMEDLDPLQPGVQAFVEGGQGEFAILPPLEPGEARVAAQSGTLRADARLDFLPEMRQVVAAGVLEGIVNLRNGASLVPAGAGDGFEQEIRHLSRDWDGGKGSAGARAAFYLKGKIRGDFLLTAAYDSDKDTQERLFRDIQPDEFYPVYGDSGPRGYDAQSTSKLYVRVDKDRSYLLWGDFTTAATGELRKLSNYNRSLTGARWHYETPRVSVDAFATRDTSRQVIEELRANGTSGPFQLGTRGGLVNSEKVELVTRDRNQPALILQAVPQGRFVDYEIDAFTGRLVFRAPVPSVDSDLNPVFVRVTYEVDQGGEAFWVVGVDGQVKVHDRVQVGATLVKDRNPLVPFTLAGANLAVRVGEGTYVIGEVARTESGLANLTGSAARIEVKHDSRNLRVHAHVARSDENFDNPGSHLNQGRGEAGARVDYKVSETTAVTAEALRTEDVKTGAVREGLAASLQYRLHKQLSLELGVRHAREKGSASPVPAVPGQPAPQPMPDEVTTVRARLTTGIPYLEGANAYGEVELDVQDADRKIVAVGGEYTFANKSRLYARHELISSITGPYGLNQNERQNTTAVGVDTEYMRDGRLFSEYRIRDAISGGDAEAALGLRNLWSIAPGVKVGTTLERVHALSGTGQNENTAAAVALEYTGSSKWKGSARLEGRQGATQESVLFTAGLAARVAEDWTVLARNSWDVTRNRDGEGKREVERLQAGIAYRDSETNKVNALARFEHRMESDSLQQEGMDLRIATQLLSINADWQLNRPFLVTGRYAARWTHDKSQGLATKYMAQVVGARATWEFAPKWDVALAMSVLAGRPGDAREYAVGVELGYLLARNLWVSAGYNFLGYKDAELQGNDQTSKGVYVRMRYKFDEAALDALAPSKAAGGAK